MNTLYTFRNGNHNYLNQIKNLTLLAYMKYRNVISIENAEVWEENLSDVNTYLKLFKIATCLVCESNSKIVGAAFLIPNGNPYKWFEADWAYIRLVAVHPDFEGKGIERKLTQMCIDLAKEMGEKVIALHTSEFQNAARHIYESSGFNRQTNLDLIYGKQYFLYTLQLK
jgi:ribosomal protein S18 acetylase RimI-like enzyme